MINGFKINKNWILTFCLVFCSMTTLFAQELTDKEIGLDVAVMTSTLTKRGIELKEIKQEIDMMREMYKMRFVEMKKNEDAILQKIRQQQVVNKTNTRNSNAANTVVIDIPQMEKDALQLLYNSTNGDNWTNRSGWDFSTPVTSWNYTTQTGWFGVFVVDGHIDYLALTNNNLVGFIPDLFGLSKLRILELDNNHFNGTAIPSTLNSLTNLDTLILNNCGFIGDIPNLSALSNLKMFFIGNNGGLNPQAIPSWIFACTNLIYLHMYYCNLTGDLPLGLFQLNQLNNLALYGNKLSGIIPSQISQLTNLRTLYMHNNQLEGSIPVEIGLLLNLDYISMSNNKLSGFIPSAISQLTNLRYLYLDNNQLEGSIPVEIGFLSKLQLLAISFNKLSGTIPLEINQLTNLQYLWLNCNQLEGSIPPEIGQLSQLTYLFLNNNKLSGILPQQIGQLTNLNSLRLNSNQLEASVPDLTNLVLLEELLIYNNKFRFVDFTTQYPIYKTQITYFQYAPQAKTDTEETITNATGGAVTLTMFTDNRYTPDDTFQWYKNYSLITGATSRQYTISNLSISDAGNYYCISKHPQITNPTIYYLNLILERNPIHLNVTNCTPVTGSLTVTTNELCKDQSSSFSFTSNTPNLSYIWTSINSNGVVVNTTTNTIGTYSFVFDSAGNYTIKLEVIKTDGCKTIFSKNVAIDNCTPCNYCASFNLIKNEKYLVSAWVKESNLATPQEQSKNYDKGCISVSFIDAAGTTIATPQKFYATGEIIDDWQRIIGEFVVPDNVDDMNLELLNENTDSEKMAYFDDIRILPSKGNMKSFVYDQKTQRLMAELDENNYSTFYEYDLEGGLVRIKKETEKGIFTIQETRSGTTKSDKP